MKNFKMLGCLFLVLALSVISSCKTNGNGTDGTTDNTTLVAIGDAYQCGVVAYILQAGDPGYDANVQHGLIAATADQGNEHVKWRWDNTSITTGAIATALGTGLANTNTIIAVAGSATGYAAGVARAYTGGGCSDWYLPSKDELYKLYVNSAAIGGFNFDHCDGCGYWSSSEIDQWDAWRMYFSEGTWPALTSTDNYMKDNTGKIRPVRSF